MPAAVLFLITHSGTIIAGVRIAFEIAMKLKALFESSGPSEFEVQIMAIQDGTLKTTAETLEIIAKWEAEHK